MPSRAGRCPGLRTQMGASGGAVARAGRARAKPSMTVDWAADDLPGRRRGRTMCGLAESSLATGAAAAAARRGGSSDDGERACSHAQSSTASPSCRACLPTSSRPTAPASTPAVPRPLVARRARRGRRHSPSPHARQSSPDGGPLRRIPRRHHMGDTLKLRLLSSDQVSTMREKCLYLLSTMGMRIDHDGALGILAERRRRRRPRDARRALSGRAHRDGDRQRPRAS